MFDDISIKLVPYLGYSKNLMEFFIIIGVKEENLIYSQNILKNEENIDLTIISSIPSNSPLKGIDLDDMIKRTYPEKPKIIRVKKSEIYPPFQNAIFSSNFYNINIDKKNDKIVYSCYALKFYEKFKDSKSNIEYYIPKAFLIISKYPFFTTFHKICLNLYKCNIEDKIIDKPVRRESIFSSKIIISKKNEFYSTDNIPIELFIYCFINYIPAPTNKTINLSILANEDKISIPKLSGYPYIDFDLCKVLNRITINELIKSYLIIFLEFPSLFFSSDLTKLNLFMFSLCALNYPLTNTKYFTHLRTISKNKMEKGIQGFNSFLGVNTDFNTKLNLSKYNSEIFLIDIENKKIFSLNESKELKKLFEYINNILNDKKQIKSSFLLKAINSLKANIELIKNLYKQKAKYQSNSYFFLSEKIIDINILIQESFYDFILNIIYISDNDYQIDKSCSIIEKRTNNKLVNLSEEENIFLKYFRKTDKYNYYYNHFIKEFDSIDELKIPLLFCKEFSHLRKYDEKNQIPNNISYFRIINNFYSTKNDKSLNITYNDLYQDFKDHKNMKDLNGIDKNEDYQLFYLDKKIINRFLFLKNNKRNLFDFLKEKEKKTLELVLNSMNKNYISTTIHNNLSSILTPYNYIGGAFVYVFSIVFPLFSFNTCIFYLANLLDNISKMKYFQRNNIYIMLKSFQKYYLVNQEKCRFSELNFENIKNYCDVIKTYLNDKFILPNKEMFLFLKQMLHDRNDNELRNNAKITDNIFVFKYDKTENYVNKIKYDIIEKEDNSLCFKYKGKRIEYNCLSCEDVYGEIYTIYNAYYSIYNFNIECLNIKKIIHIIINLIYYLLQPDYNEESMALFLYKTVIVLNKLEEDLNKYKEKHNYNKLLKTYTGEININNRINIRDRAMTQYNI